MNTLSGIAPLWRRFAMRDSEYTMVFGTSLITASPPHISPYSVQ